MKRKIKQVLVVFTIALAGGLAALGISKLFNHDSSKSISEIQQTYSTSGLAVSSIPNIDFVEVSGKAINTVVHIKTTYGVSVSEKKGSGDEQFFDPLSSFMIRV